MAISDNYTPIRQLGNGVTTVFTGSWQLFSSSYIRVYLESVSTSVQTLQALGVDYTLSFNGSGFTVTFTTAPTSADYVVIARAVALEQSEPYKTSTGFQGYNLETSLDKLVAMVQDVDDKADRGFKYQVGSTVTGDIPNPQADKFLKRNTANDGYEWSSVSDYSGTSTTSLSIGTGSKTFTTESGKSWFLGQRLRAASDDGTLIMDGEVTAYSGTSLTILVDYTEGSGTHADWNIGVTGSRGATGAAGGPLVDGDYGDVTVSGSGTVITIDNSVVTNAKLANMAGNSVKVRDASGAGVASDLVIPSSHLLGRGSSGNISQIGLGSNLTMSGTTLDANVGGGGLIDVQVFTSSGTWTRPSGTAAIEIEVVGGGGSGGNNLGGGSGGTSSFGSHCSATGGSGGGSSSGGLGGSGGGGSGGTLNINGQAGGTRASSATGSAPGFGGSSQMGRGGLILFAGSASGSGYGAGGSGGSSGVFIGGGGGGGGYAYKRVTTGIGATETVTVGAAGSGGEANATPGIIIVKSYL
jgi:hypothetical protein